MTQEFVVESVGCRFRIKDREIDAHVRDVALRWLRRGTDRRVNGPSLELETEYDPPLRQTFLYTFADSVSGDAPQSLEDVVVNRAGIRIPR